MPWRLDTPAGHKLLLDPAYTSNNWVESGNVNPVTSARVASNGDSLGQIDDYSYGAHRVIALSASARATWQTDSGRPAAYKFDGTNAHLTVKNSKGAFRFIHVERTFTIICWVKVTADGVLYNILDNCNGSGANTGIEFYRSSGNKIGVFIVKGSTIVSFTTTTQTLTAAMGWTRVVVKCNAGSGSVQVGAGTPETFTCGAGAAAGTDAFADLEIGATTGAGQKLNGYLGPLAIYDTVLGSSDIASFDAYNPSVVQYSQLDYTTGLATKTGVGASFDPTWISALQRWHDPSDTAWNSTDSAGAVPVASDGDLVQLCENKTGTQYKRAMRQATLASRPAYKLNQFGTRAGALFDGANDYWTLDDPTGSGGQWTLMMVLAELSDGGTTHRGSHTFGPAPWLVQTGLNYPGNAGYHNLPYVYQHVGSTGINTTALAVGQVVNLGGPNIIEVVRDGNRWSGCVNGIASLDAFAINPTNLQFSAFGQDTTGTNQWWMFGPVGEIAFWLVAHPYAYRSPVRSYMATRWGVPNVSTVAPGTICSRRETSGSGRSGSRSAA
jgi:hypothetical protein